MFSWLKTLFVGRIWTTTHSHKICFSIGIIIKEWLLGRYLRGLDVRESGKSSHISENSHFGEWEYSQNSRPSSLSLIIILGAIVILVKMSSAWS